MSLGSAAFRLSNQLSPILLTGGIAQSLFGGALPIIAITEAAHFVSGLLSGADNIELDNFFANFQPLQGGTLIDYQVGTYPLANQAVAGNALIAQPLNLSMQMICPARDHLGYPLKLATMIALKNVLDKHVALGGTFVVITPSYFYTNGLLLRMADISNPQSKQVQNTWQLDFYFPLLTVEAAQSVQNSLLSKVTGGQQVDGSSWSGTSPTVGQPNSLAASSIMPSAASLPAANTASFAGGLT